MRTDALRSIANQQIEVSQTQVTTIALISQRAIGKAITQDNLTGAKGGLHDLIDQLGARRIKEQRLRPR